MPITSEEIKKMTDAEKLKLIDTLLESIGDDSTDEHLNENQESTLLNQRMEQYRTGNMKFDNWENVKERLMKKIQNREKKHRNGL